MGVVQREFVVEWGKALRSSASLQIADGEGTHLSVRRAWHPGCGSEEGEEMTGRSPEPVSKVWCLESFG